jgi:hypothetical protein
MDLLVGGAEDCGLLEAEVPPEEEPWWDSRWCCCSAATRFLGPPMVKLGGLGSGMGNGARAVKRVSKMDF